MKVYKVVRQTREYERVIAGTFAAFLCTGEYKSVIAEGGWSRTYTRFKTTRSQKGLLFVFKDIKRARAFKEPSETILECEVKSIYKPPRRKANGRIGWEETWLEWKKCKRNHRATLGFLDWPIGTVCVKELKPLREVV